MQTSKICTKNTEFDSLLRRLESRLRSSVLEAFPSRDMVQGRSASAHQLERTPDGDIVMYEMGAQMEGKTHSIPLRQHDHRSGDNEGGLESISPPSGGNREDLRSDLHVPPCLVVAGNRKIDSSHLISSCRLLVVLFAACAEKKNGQNDWGIFHSFRVYYFD